MIEASVWIAPSIWKSVSDLTERPVWETTPVESEWSSPNGEPMTAIGWPTTTLSLSASVERGQVDLVRVDLEQGDIGERVESEDLGREDVAVVELDVDLVGRLPVFAFAVGDDMGVGDQSRRRR